jgi:hypothetical protein
MWQGTWQVRDDSLRLKPFGRLPTADRAALMAEAARLCTFIAPDTPYDLVLDEP